MHDARLVKSLAAAKENLEAVDAASPTACPNVDSGPGSNV